jgi:hypothetical protein
MAGEVPDRVPISTYELVGWNSRAWENNDPSYSQLMDVIRERTECLAMWNPRSNGRFLVSAHPIELETEQWREGEMTVTRTTAHTPKGPLTRKTREADDVHTVWITEHWCKSLEDVEAALSVPYVPLDYDASDYDRIAAEVGDHGVIMASLSDPLVIAGGLMSFGDYTVWAMTETDHFVRVLDILHERVMENLRRMLDVNVVDVYRICGPEYATPPYMPPALFERFVVPYVREMTDLLHERGAYVRLHSHGKIGRVLESILATGADGLDPCEGPPDGDITLAELKARVGDKLCLFGNLQLKLLETRTPDDVERAVIACMDAAKAGGGYVIMPTAAPINTPLSPQTEANYLRYIEAAHKYGRY